MIDFDSYPDNTIPSVCNFSIINYLEYSAYYLIFWLVYLLLNILIFVPIPVTIVWEAFILN